MTQTTIRTAPAGLGLAFAQVYATATSITADQRHTLSETWSLADADAYATAVKRVDEAMELLGVETENFSSPAIITDTVYAVLALDRGLISSADFQAITVAWTAAGLPLPMQLDGDEAIPSCANIDVITSDALADELLHATDGTDQYGAVLMLTGYNYGELLAYRSVRKCLDRRSNGEFIVDWKALGHALNSADVNEHDVDVDVDVDEVEENTADAIEVALSLLPLTDDNDDCLLDFIGEANAEPFVTAVAYSFGVEHLLNGGGADTSQPAAVVPQPRQWEPSA